MQYRVLALLVFGLTAPQNAQAQQDSSPPCANPPRIKAVARPDNDISFSTQTGSSIQVPAPVQDKINALAAEACFEVRAYSTDSLPLASFYGVTFVVSSPDDFQVFAFSRPQVFASSVFFILYDTPTHRLTPTPVEIYAKWAHDDDGVCERPFVTFEDLDHDGRKELVIRERTHNGTSYNACVRHYYRVGSDLSLFPMLAVEERSLQDFLGVNNAWLLRRVRFVSRDSLTVVTILSTPGHPERKVGEVLLSRHATAHYAGCAYQLTDTRVVDPKFQQALITDSPAHDENFILTGKTLWY